MGKTISLTRRATGEYTATNADGATIDFGGEGQFSPVDLLLAALAGCSAIDVDVVTSRRAEPTRFELTASGEKVTDEDGGKRLGNVRLAFDVDFADDEQGNQARGLVDRLIQLSHEKDCTVSRTIEHPTDVEFVRL